MKRKSVLIRRLEIQKQLHKISKKQKSLKEQFEKEKKKCNHEICVTTWITDISDGNIFSFFKPRSYCLLCHEHLAPRKYVSMAIKRKMDEAVNINMQGYPNIFKYWGAMNYEKNLERMYLEIRKENKNCCENEIGRIMKKRLEVFDTFM